MRAAKALFALPLAFLLCASAIAQQPAKEAAKETRIRPEDLPTSGLISQPGPTFKVSSKGKHVTLIVYGDQRFTDPANIRVTDPVARRLLVAKLAEEHPDAILLNGDVPYSGDNVDDYRVYHDETASWRDAKLNVFPALGNHEFHGDPSQALEHWWSAFPELRNRRWYSAQVGKSVYTISLDSDASLLPDSDQQNWLSAQLKTLPKSIKFVFISLHHPPVADVQTHINISHNPRPNEIALRDYLSSVAPGLHAHVVVCAGHIHNYERFSQLGVTYLVSGGGGASPVPVERTPDDLYQNTGFPNFHYVKFEIDGDSLTATMIRLNKTAPPDQQWTEMDHFKIPQ
ncbi:metallophosphoesterase family protein [Occallatibacter savannae]|uniref:metallophosphoesterase family protein n=1 Tax=Occallatibacter savannae TaxID=1002691 RepID=UPI0013A5A7CA|nr:metallophosphoesterase [Occallatibacter savannae]